MKKIINFFTILFICIFLVACGSKKENVPQVQGQAGDNSIALTQGLIKTLEKQLGRSYKLGGSSPSSGFDCSGLIYWGYKQHGITVPRVTVEQARAGSKVPKNSLRPGDIMVFRSKDSPNGLHTAVYMGNNRIIHAPNARKDVEIEILKGGYWGGQFIQARRVVGPIYNVR